MERECVVYPLSSQYGALTLEKEVTGTVLEFNEEGAAQIAFGEPISGMEWVTLK